MAGSKTTRTFERLERLEPVNLTWFELLNRFESSRDQSPVDEIVAMHFTDVKTGEISPVLGTSTNSSWMISH